MNNRREIVFIDTSLTDWQTLLAGIESGVETVLIDPNTDGLKQIAAHLSLNNQLSHNSVRNPETESELAEQLSDDANSDPYDAIHILSHGSAGQLYLGSTVLNVQNLHDYQGLLQQIGAALTDTGDMLLYGCNVADGEAGEQFITALAASTGADVAASTDLTGAAALGGDWMLEANSGMIEATSADAITNSVLLYSAIDGTSMSLRKLIDDTVILNTDDLQNQTQSDFNYISNISIEKTGLFDWIPFVDYGAYDVSAALYRASLIGNIYTNFQLAAQQNDVITSELFELSFVDGKYFEDELTRIVSEYSDNANLDFDLQDLVMLFEGALGFVNVFVGNVKDVAIELFDSIDAAYKLLSSSFKAVELIKDTSLYIYENVYDQLTLSTVDSAMKSIWSVICNDIMTTDLSTNGVMNGVIEKFNTAIVNAMRDIFSNLAAEDYQRLADQTGNMLSIMESNIDINQKMEAFFDGWNFLVANGFSLEDRANILFGIDVDFWRNSESKAFNAGNVLGIIENLLKAYEIGHDIGGLTTYLDSGDEGLDYGAREIAQLAINIKWDEFFTLLTKTASDFYPAVGVTGFAVETFLNAFDTFFESRNVSLTYELGQAIDRVDTVSSAQILAFNDYQQLLGQSVQKLGADWGDDLLVLQSLPVTGGTLIGTEYNEKIIGSAYRDVINGAGGNDAIYGEAGNDRIAGDAGLDTIHGGYGQDEIYGGDDNDTLYGDQDNDTLKGEKGDDSLYGGPGNDTLYGDENNDRLLGEDGTDTLYGGSGADILHGGLNADTLFGQSGSDTFRFETGDSSGGAPDVIRDFNQGNTGSYDASEADVIDVSDIVGAAYNGGAGQDAIDLVRLKQVSDGGTTRTALQVDQDGTGNAYGWTTLAYLDGVAPGAPISIILDPNHTPQNGTVGTVDQQTTVRSQPGSWSISPGSKLVDEVDGSISFLVTRQNTSQAETAYISTTINQGYANDGDYEYWLNEPVTFAVGQDEYTVNIHINDDNHDEVIETFGLIVQSSPSQPASEYLAQATFSIIDDDLAGSSATFTPNNDLVWIDPNGGAEYFDGLAGNDTATLNLSSWSEGINTDNYSGALTFSHGSDSLRFTNVENFFVIAGSGNDNLSPGDGTNGLFGGAGNDNLYAGAGFDILDGGAGDDSFHSVYYGDFVAGGIGTDTVNFELSERTNNITINLSTGQGPGATWTGVDFVSGSLGSGNDNVTAGMQLKYINGGGGVNSLTLDYSGTLADGRTAKRIDFSRSMDSNGTNQTVVLSDDSVLKFGITYFERLNIIGTSGDDTLSANNGYNGAGGSTFYGGDGNDILTGGASTDLLDGGAGNDTFHNVGIGDTVKGGSGTDTVNFDLSTQTDGATIDLTSNSGLAAPWTGVEFATGHFGKGDDSFTATMQLNHLYDNGGNDSLTLDYSGTLADGRTAKRIDFSRSMDSNGSNQTVVLSDDSVLKFGITYFERLNIIGTSGDDTLSANNGYNGAGGSTFYGGDGNDTLIGGTGVDLLDGGAGNDNLIGGNGDDILIGSTFSSTPEIVEVDTLTGGSGRDTFVLGDLDWLGYDDQDANSNGTGDYALIKDFTRGEDTLQLHGSATQYLQQIVGQNVHLYFDKAGTEPDELIAILESQNGQALDTQSFLFIKDTDGDGVLDHEDNAILVPNADQRDTDGDGYGNIVDADLNNDMTINFADLSLMKQRFFSADADADLDGNGSVNFADLSILKSMFFKPPGDSYVDHTQDNEVITVENVTEPVNIPAIELIGVSVDPFWG